MKGYVSPELKVLKVNVMDIIRTSSAIEDGSGNGGNGNGDGNVGGESGRD